MFDVAQDHVLPFRAEQAHTGVKVEGRKLPRRHRRAMVDKKFKYVPFVTEIMTARHPRLSEPDTMGEYADGKYKTEATADKTFTTRLQEEVQAVVDRYFPGKKNVHLPWKETAEGAIAFNFKSPKEGARACRRQRGGSEARHHHPRWFAYPPQIGRAHV